jgi:hypothetical protein
MNIAYYEKALYDDHTIPPGLILPTLVKSPLDSRLDCKLGNYENCAIWTAACVLSESLKYANTGDVTAKRRAAQGVTALQKLHDVTGQPGLIARGYRKTRIPIECNKITTKGLLWDEDLYWKKKGDSTRQNDEWHQNPDGWRWLGDASKSQVFGVTLGYFAYNHYCNPDIEEKQRMGRYLCNIVDGIMDDPEMVLRDVDGKPTGYGKYSPKVAFGCGGTGPSLLLGMLKLASSLTGDQKYENKYYELIFEKDWLPYLSRGGLALPNKLKFVAAALAPVYFTAKHILKRLSTSFGSDDNLVMLNSFMLHQLESDKTIRKSLEKESRERYRTMSVIHPENNTNSLLNFLNHAITGENDVQLGVEALSRMPQNIQVPVVALKRKSGFGNKIASILGSRLKPEDWPVDEYAWRLNFWRRDKWVPQREGVMQFAPVDRLLAHNLGVHVGAIKSNNL